MNEKNKKGETALHIATANNKVKIFKKLLELGANYDLLDREGRNLYDIALANKATDIIELLNTKENNNMTNLLIAIEKNNEKDIKIFLEKGIDVNSKDLKGESLLYKIISLNNLELIKHFMEKGVQVGTSELQKTVEIGNLEILKEFKNKGINLFYKSKFEESLMYLAIKNNHFEIVKYLSEYIPKEFKENKLIIDIALSFGREEILNYLLEREFSINSLNKDLLFWAIKNNKLTLTEKLLLNTSNMSLKDENGRSPTMIAVAYDAKEVFELIMTKGGKFDERDKNNYSLLMLAARYNSTIVGEILVKAKLSVDEAMFIAIAYDSIDMVKLLHKRGAKIKQSDDNGVTYLMYAGQFGSINSFKYLMDRGLNPETEDKNGENALMYAARGGSLNIVKLLVDKGLSKKIKNKKGEDLFNISKTIEIRDYLVSQGLKK